MSQPIELSPGTVAVRLPDSHAFTVDPVLALRAIGRIAEECQGKTNYEHLELFRSWVRENCAVTLTLAQADELWDALQAAYLDAKKKRLATPSSPPSTASTPSP